MNREWFPWYPARFRADTIHLTAEEDGIYRRLIDHYMETGLPLPDSDPALARIAGISVDSWDIAAAIVRPFFRQQDGKLWLKKCDEILADQAARSEKNSRKGRAGAEKRWKAATEIPEDYGSGYTELMAEPKQEYATGQDKTVQEREEKDSGGVESRAAAVIALFNSCTVEVFGAASARAFASASDKVFAERFLDAGIPEDWLKSFFLERLGRRKRDGKGPIGELSYLKDAVPEAYRGYLEAKTVPLGTKKQRPSDEQPILKTMSVAEKERRNDYLQRLQSAGRA